MGCFIFDKIIYKKNNSSSTSLLNRSEEGLTLETLAFKLLMVANLRLNTKLPNILSHRRSTTVSLETYPLLLHWTSKVEQEIDIRSIQFVGQNVWIVIKCLKTR